MLNDKQTHPISHQYTQPFCCDSLNSSGITSSWRGLKSKLCGSMLMFAISIHLYTLWVSCVVRQAVQSVELRSDCSLSKSADGSCRVTSSDGRFGPTSPTRGNQRQQLSRAANNPPPLCPALGGNMLLVTSRAWLFAHDQKKSHGDNFDVRSSSNFFWFMKQRSYEVAASCEAWCDAWYKILQNQKRDVQLNHPHHGPACTWVGLQNKEM